MGCPDNYSAFERYSDQQEREHERWYNSLPVCEHCQKKIEDEDLIDVEGYLYHVDCFMKNHKKCTDDYVI